MPGPFGVAAGRIAGGAVLDSLGEVLGLEGFDQVPDAQHVDERTGEVLIPAGCPTSSPTTFEELDQDLSAERWLLGEPDNCQACSLPLEVCVCL